MGVDLADIQLTIKYNKRIRSLLRVINIFSKYAWSNPLKTQKGVVSAFQSILHSPKRRSNKIWVVQGSEFCKNSFKKWLKDNVVEIY